MSEGYKHIEVSARDGVLVVTILVSQMSQYELACEVRDEMLDAVQRHTGDNVVLDLKNVEMMTSVGLLPLIRLRSTIQQAGGKLVLCDLSDAVLQVLTISQLIVERREHAQNLPMSDDLDAALARFTSGSN